MSQPARCGQASPRLRKARGLLAASALAAGLMLGVAACGTGFGAQSNAIYDPGLGTNSRGGGVDVLNALLVDNGSGSGTLSATLVGDYGQTRQLTQVTAMSLQHDDLKVALTSGPVNLAPGCPVQLGRGAAVVISGSAVAPGYVVTVDFSFTGAQQVSLPVLVVARSSMYASVATASAPTGSATTPAPTTPAPTAATSSSGGASSGATVGPVLCQ